MMLSVQADKPENTKMSQNVLPDFIAKGDKTDKLLFAAFFAMSFYALALIPFRAKLLVDFTFLNIFLTGGNFSVTTMGARHADNVLLLLIVLLVATLSMAKFLPLYYLMGKRWGPAFFDIIFNSHKPFWFRKLEQFIYRHPAVSMFISCIPFSPVSPIIVTVAAGMTKVNAKKFTFYALGFILMLKSFYLLLGILFGTEVLSVLKVIDRYMLWVTLALMAYLFVVIFVKNYRAETQKQKQQHSASDNS